MSSKSNGSSRDVQISMLSLTPSGTLELINNAKEGQNRTTDTVHQPQAIRSSTHHKGHAYYHNDHWFHHLIACYGSVIPTIAPRVLIFVIWAAAVRLFEYFLDWSPDISTSIHGVAGTALGLLLVFRTNSAYDRFWEGRKKWGMIINRTRDLARQAVAWIDDERIVERIVRHTIAFAYACRAHLRASRNIDDVDDILSKQEFFAMANAEHIPLKATVVIAECIRKAKNEKKLGPYAAQSLDMNLTSLLDQIGACERIKKTPIPFSYVMHTRRFITIYLLTLPFALSTLEWYMIPAVGGLSYAFLGIEAIAIEIEDPFQLGLNDLPLGGMCDTIRKNLLHVMIEYLSRRVDRGTGSADPFATVFTKPTTDGDKNGATSTTNDSESKSSITVPATRDEKIVKRQESFGGSL